MSLEETTPFFMMAGTEKQLCEWAGCTLKEVEKRVLDICKEEPERFQNLAMALSRYDYCGAPSNWRKEDNFQHEKTIVEWARYVLEEEDKEDIDDVLEEYRAGKVPYCSSFMENYFC